mmetsp:Transcript_8446/g.15906  ORF Transcript_8446/g.15906 Transcript_8446/m.15906 type:complete len:212 (+) Transcript_8446:75-710(+)
MQSPRGNHEQALATGDFGRNPHVVPPTKSLHETGLYSRDSWKRPEMTGPQAASDALASDAARLRKKYLGNDPNGHTAHFILDMPVLPQHPKFSYQVGRSAESPREGYQDTTRREALFQSGGFTLTEDDVKSIFGQLESDGHGCVSTCEMITALRQHPQYQAAIFCRTDDIMAQVEENKRLLALLQRIPGDGRGKLDWHSFRHFFREAGLLR